MTALHTLDVITLWPDAVGPGSEKLSIRETVTERSRHPCWPDRILTGITRPRLTAFVPRRPNGAAVIVAAGGAYGRIVLDKESTEMALWLNTLGVTSLLMHYRLPAEGHADGPDAPVCRRTARHARVAPKCRELGSRPCPHRFPRLFRRWPSRRHARHAIRSPSRQPHRRPRPIFGASRFHALALSGDFDDRAVRPSRVARQFARQFTVARPDTSLFHRELGATGNSTVFSRRRRRRRCRFARKQPAVRRRGAHSRRRLYAPPFQPGRPRLRHSRRPRYAGPVLDDAGRRVAR